MLYKFGVIFAVRPTA